MGCVIHSTRGKASEVDEFRATYEWFGTVASQVSAHIVIDHDGTICVCVDPALIAWHGRAHNERYLGAELVQPYPGDQVTDEQLRSLGWWLRVQAARFGFELVALNLPEHRDFDPQKSDVGPDYSLARLQPFLGFP